MTRAAQKLLARAHRHARRRSKPYPRSFASADEIAACRLPDDARLRFETRLTFFDTAQRRFPALLQLWRRSTGCPDRRRRNGVRRARLRSSACCRSSSRMMAAVRSPRLSMCNRSASHRGFDRHRLDGAQKLARNGRHRRASSPNMRQRAAPSIRFGLSQR